MKKTLIALAVLGLAAGSAFATGGGQTTPPLGTVSVTGTGTNTVTSSTGASASVVGVGSASSTATNFQSALSWVAGAGSLTKGPGSATVSLENCEPINVTGTLLTGNVLSKGGIQVTGQSDASVVTTGTGTGAAQALGSSFASVSGVTTLVSPNMNLSASGDAAGVVATDTGLVTSGSATSTGSLAAGWTSSQTGTLLTASMPGITGDLKTITSTANAYVGGIPGLVSDGECGTKCVAGDTVATPNAYVAGVANAFTGGEGTGIVTNTLTLTNTTIITPPPGGGGGGGDDHEDGGDKGPKKNNGYGNLDQGAPGNSGPNNGAENDKDGGKGKNGKDRNPN